ncbi:MAG TPA: hypothetical protein VJ793_15225 [Anaerolineae bacterium]|nr:hypothetical protein [Anaerolineae bacterium]
MSALMKLQFKFSETTTMADRKKVLDGLSRQGAVSVRPLFPEEKDAELATLYMVDFVDDATGRRLLKLLTTSKAVEFAEKEARRKLIGY